MPLKFAAVYELCKHVLLENRHGAGIKAQLAGEFLHELFRQYHVADTYTRGDGAGKGVNVYYALAVEGINRAYLPEGGGELGVLVVFYSIRIVAASPVDIFKALCRARGDAAGEAVVRGHMQGTGTAAG